MCLKTVKINLEKQGNDFIGIGYKKNGITQGKTWCMEKGNI